jgi:RNA polymerase sigma-70 factor (ECF subfamily)
MPILSPDTSASLLNRLRDPRAADAWKRLCDLYTPLLHLWLRSAGLQPADCEDLSQRVLEVLCRQLPLFQHNGRAGAFRAWLRAIVSNLLRELWRQRKAAESGAILDQLADPSTDLSRRWDEQHDRHVLHALMEAVRHEFAETTWKAFCRLTLDEVPAPVVAGELGLTVNGVYGAKFRVLARLRQEAAGLLD